MGQRIHLTQDLSLPLDIVTERTLVLGVSGSGKSTFGRLLLECVHDAGQRFCVIDMKNDWWGLKSSADGKRPGIPAVIIGGPRADVLLDADAGAEVADLVVAEPHSFIIDLDELSKGKGIRFIGAFMARLYEKNRDPLLLVCDEGDLYAPQKTLSPEQAITLGAADDIARRGRKRGIGTLWLSQRPAVINKNITSQCGLVVTFRTSASLDLKELKEHIGRVAKADQVDDIMSRVAELENGEAIFMSQAPATRMFKTAQLPMPETFDSSATPKVGERRVEPKQLAAPDLAALGERIKAAREKALADDPKHLRERIVELEAQLNAGEEGDSALHDRIAKLEEDLENALNQEPAEVPALQPEQLRDLHDVLASAVTVRDELTKLVERWDGRTLILKGALEQIQAPISGDVERFVRRVVPDRVPAARVARIEEAPAKTKSGLGKGERIILTAIAQHREGVTREQLTVLTGYKKSSRDTYLQKLGAGGLVQLGDRIVATKAGMAELGAGFRPLPTGDALRKHWLERLGGGERALLEAIVTKWPHDCSRDWLSEITEYKKSSRDTYLQKLVARRLIEAKSGGVVRASDSLFDKGARR